MGRISASRLLSRRGSALTAHCTDPWRTDPATTTGTGGTRRAVTDAWTASGGGWTTSCSNWVNVSVDSVIDATIKKLGRVSQVIAILA
ncbi:hypothetical protein [Streptomyces sp. NPDC001222]|uniref:hypothetical protein n=1 Tax=Streptomyces sp. NPDC001222 TaxID=3364548 RepID=UPI0036BCB563